MLPPRPRYVVLVAWAGFIAAQASNAIAYQRYYEPMVLIVAALCVAEIPEAARSRFWRTAWVGPLCLAGLLAAITFKTLR